MKHNINELYHIDGQKLYTEDYIKANNIPKATIENHEGWSRVSYVLNTSASKERNLHTANGVKKIYIYGEKTWFDTLEEREEHKKIREQERAEQSRRAKAVRTINEYLATLSTDDLEDLIKGLN